MTDVQDEKKFIRQGYSKEMVCGMKEIHLTEASPRDDIGARVMDQRHKNCY